MVNSTGGNNSQSKTITANISTREQFINIPAKTTAELDFMNTFPNYVYVNNYSGGTCYFGRSVFPSAQVYDMIIDGYGDNLYASPNNFNVGYIYNDGADVANIKVTTFDAPFNPSALKGGGGTATSTGGGGPAANTDSTIVGYNVPLPAGNNHIGVVTVDTMPAQTFTMDTLPPGTNHIGTVDVGILPALSTGTSHIGSVGIDGGVTISSMPPVTVSNNPIPLNHQIYEGDVAQTVINFPFVDTNGTAMTVNTFNYVKNDGDTDLFISFGTTDPSTAGMAGNGENLRIRIAAGESINNFERQTGQINFYRTTGTGGVRMLAG
jgi:hypothetical protein